MRPSASLVLLLLIAGCTQGTPAREGTDSAPGMGSVTGLVLDNAVRPLAGVDVVLAPGLATRTDDDGLFEFRDVAPGAYILTANRTGFLPAQAAVNVAAGSAADVRLTMNMDDSPVPYHDTVEFDGFVDASFGLLTPVADALLREEDLAACDCSFIVETPRAPASFILEATWTDNVADPVGATEYVYRIEALGTNLTAVGQGANPIVREIGRFDFASPDFDFANTDRYRVSVYPDASWPAVQQDYEVFVTLFFYEPAPDGWSFIDGDP